VRQDEAMRQQIQWQAQLDLQNQQFQFTKDQAAIGNEQWNRQQDTSERQWDQQWAFQMAQELALKSGDYSLYRALGLSDEQINNMKSYFDGLQQQAAAQATQWNGTGSGTTTTKYYDPSKLLEDAYNSGQGSLYIRMNAQKYGIDAGQIDWAIAEFLDWEEGQGRTEQAITSYEQLSETAKGLAGSISRNYGTVESKVELINSALDRKSISEAEAQFLLDSLGIQNG
jgi:hypothetical protein